MKNYVFATLFGFMLYDGEFVNVANHRVLFEFELQFKFEWNFNSIID